MQTSTLSTSSETQSPSTPSPISSGVSATPLIANVSILPPDLPANANMAAAELLYASSPAPLLYASNRNLAIDPKNIGDGDSITILRTTLRSRSSRTSRRASRRSARWRSSATTTSTSWPAGWRWRQGVRARERGARMAQAGCQFGPFPDHPAYVVRFHVSASNITRNGGADLPGIQGTNLGIASASYQKMWLTSGSAREYGREWRAS